MVIYFMKKNTIKIVGFHTLANAMQPKYSKGKEAIIRLEAADNIPEI